VVPGEHARQRTQPECLTIHLRPEEGRDPDQWGIPHDSCRGTKYRAVSHADGTSN
jgi:hypothetical protein